MWPTNLTGGSNINMVRNPNKKDWLVDWNWSGPLCPKSETKKTHVLSSNSQHFLIYSSSLQESTAIKRSYICKYQSSLAKISNSAVFWKEKTQFSFGMALQSASLLPSVFSINKEVSHCCSFFFILFYCSVVLCNCIKIT